MTLLNRTRGFEPPAMVFCQYTSREINIYDYANREPKIACVNYGLLTRISEIKNNLGIDTSIVPKNVVFYMQKHDDQHKLLAHALAIYDSSAFAFILKTSRSRLDVPILSGTPILNVSAYIPKLPNVTCDDVSELDAHLAPAPMRLTTNGVDPKAKQARLILVSSFTQLLGGWDIDWAQQKTKALYCLNIVTQLVDLVMPGFVIKDYQAHILNLLVKLEQGNSDVPDYTRKVNDYNIFWKSEISEKYGTYLYIMSLRS